MAKQTSIDMICLDDDEDDLIALCGSFSTERNESTKSTHTGRANGLSPSSSQQKSILNYVNVYRQNAQNTFELVRSNGAIDKTQSTAATKEVIYLDDDDDDDDLMKAISLSLSSQANSTRHNQTVQQKITSAFPSTSSTNVFGASEEMSDADVKAISGALDELERSYNNHIDEATLHAIELIDIADILETVELESYNKNAATIRSLSIVHPDLEHLDPNPDIFELYRQFDQNYFEGFLTSKALKLGWANNFYSVAGTYYSCKDGVPTILLSANLLTLRPRKDLVETLLHEMIHAYIDLQRIRDNNDHGNVFQFHMRRINQLTGASITIYHTFHDEVSFLRKYIWRCTGSKCQAIQPYRGYISLATKRKPSRWDKAFRIHQQIGCSGSFEQVSNNFTNTTNKKNAKKKN